MHFVFVTCKKPGFAYRRHNDVADNMPFAVALGAAFDLGAVKRDQVGRWILAVQLDGTQAKPVVTMQQLAAVSFKVLVPYL